MRAAPLADDIRPIRPGLEGGRYKALAEADLGRIHEAVLTLLETVGFANAIPSCIEALTRVGATHSADGRIRFPRALVEDTIKRAARNFTLHGQDPKHDMLIQGKRVHYGTAGAAVHLVDVEKREYRESLLQDIYDAARIVDGLDNIHFFQRPMVPRDIPDPLDMDFNTLYACVMGTSKHVGTSFTVRENVAPALEMLYAIAGGEENFPRAALRLQLQLLRRAADEVRRGRLRRARSLRRRRHPDPAALRRPGRRDRARRDRRRGRAGGRRSAGRPRLCQRAEARPSGDLRHLAVRLGLAGPARCRAARPSRRC